MPSLSEIVEAFQSLYDPRWAEPWDAVGLVCGEPDAQVGSVLFAIDPVASVVDEALARGADLVITHHPLFLRPVHGVPATSAKGRVVHRLISGGTALLVTHTNADAADPGVSDALAAALGLGSLSPLDRRHSASLDKVVTFVPVEQTGAVVDALSAAGAGAIGDYDRCAWTVVGTGTFRPLPGARPAIGHVGAIEDVVESRVEMVLPRDRRDSVVAALRFAHPYEEPAFDLYELAPQVGRLGIGRIGFLDRPESLADFAGRVAHSLPATAAGVRVSGDPARPVRSVAVCGGSGDGLIDAAREAGADVFVTADLRHHPASEAEGRGMALVDVAHWSSEWPWLEVAAQRLTEAMESRGTTVDTYVSQIRTDPWTMQVPSNPSTTHSASTVPGS